MASFKGIYLFISTPCVIFPTTALLKIIMERFTFLKSPPFSYFTTERPGTLLSNSYIPKNLKLCTAMHHLIVLHALALYTLN